MVRLKINANRFQKNAGVNNGICIEMEIENLLRLGTY